MNENQTPVSDANPSEPTRRSKKRLVLLACVAGLVGLNMLSNYLGIPTVTTSKGMRIAIPFEGEFPFSEANVRFYTHFVSGNPLCSPSSFLGTLIGQALVSPSIGMESAYVVAPVEIQRLGGNRFKGLVYMDYFRKGWCGWRWTETLSFDVRPNAATAVPPLSQWPYALGPGSRPKLIRGTNISIKCTYTKAQVFGCAKAPATGAERRIPDAIPFVAFEVAPRSEEVAR